ncbi:MAG: hypothetical protein LAP13_17605 [Acidobacteriia bacterium]|nr:hypothetical protein [Terriglobia bacterium]
MGSHLNPEKAIWQGVERRRSTRLTVTIPITLRGKEAGGREFRERTRAVTLNNHGARIITVHELLPGSELTIENPSAGLAVPGIVVWSSERRTPRDPFEVGIELVKPGNVWGIEFPPENWQEGVGVPAAAAEASASATAEPEAAAAVAVASVPAGVQEPPAVPAPASTTDALSPGPEVDSALAWLASRTDEIKEKQARDFELRLNKIAGLVAAHTQTLIQESITAATEKIQPELDRQLESVNGQLRASRSEVEDLQRQLAEIQRKTLADTESVASRVQGLEQNAQGEVAALESKLGEIRAGFQAASVREAQEASRQQLRQDAEEVLVGLRGELKTVVKSLVDETRVNLAALTRNTVEAMNREGKSGLEQYRGVLRKGLQEHAEKGARELAGQVEKSLESRRAALEAQLQKAAAQAVIDVRTSAKELLKEAVQTLNQQKAAREDAQESAEAREQAISQIRAAADQSVADASEALKKQSFATFISLKDLNAQIEARLQTIPQQVEQQANTALDTVRQQADATVTSALARFIDQVQAHLKDSERSLGQVLQGSEGRMWETLQPRIQKFGDEMLAASAVQLGKQNDEMAALFAEQLKEKQQQAADAAVEAFRTKISEMLAIFQMGAKK